MTNGPRRNEIEQICLAYLREFHNVRCDERLVLDYPFTDRAINLSGSDLYRMLMWLEGRFRIYISPERVRKEGFHTIREAAEPIDTILEERNG